MCAAIAQCPDIEPLGLATVPDDSFSTAPDVAVLDLDFQSDNHRDLLRRLRGIAPNVKVCALAFQSLPATIRQCLNLGAGGFLLKDCTVEELCRAIRAVARDEVFIDPRVAGALLRRDDERAVPGPWSLSEREVDVIRLIAVGLTNRQIASDLRLSEKTVKNHVSHIFRKLKVTARTQAAIQAIAEGLLRPVGA